ncbi:MAG: hypothetical protein AAF404_22005, partial [Pseudomonadota bacterium]
MNHKAGAAATSCCTPRAATGKRKSAQPTPAIIPASNESFDVCDIPGGEALTGTNTPLLPIDEESPCR